MWNLFSIPSAPVILAIEHNIAERDEVEPLKRAQLH
jgi:hypothetical protein